MKMTIFQGLRHGLAAIVLATASLAAFSAENTHTGTQDPAEIVDKINDALCRDNRESMFITLVVGEKQASTASEMSDAIVSAVDAFTGDYEQSDDITLLVLDYLP